MGKQLFLAVLAFLLFSCGSLPQVDSSQGNKTGTGEDKAVSQAMPYEVGPGDVLNISVWKEEGLDQEVLVRPDGGISFPLAGDIKAAGKTPEKIRDEIAKNIRRYIPEAVVTVSVKELSGYQVYVLGKVNEPGQYSVGRYVDVMQALTLAGGLTPYAEGDGIKILRRQGDKKVVYRFRYSRVKNGRDLDQNILLKSGDVVVVP